MVRLVLQDSENLCNKPTLLDKTPSFTNIFLTKPKKPTFWALHLVDLLVLHCFFGSCKFHDGASQLVLCYIPF